MVGSGLGDIPVSRLHRGLGYLDSGGALPEFFVICSYLINVLIAFFVPDSLEFVYPFGLPRPGELLA